MNLIIKTMGSSTSQRGPTTKKSCIDGENELLKFGLAEMQGWRGSMVIYKK